MTIGALYQAGHKFLGTGAVDAFSLKSLLMVYENLPSISDVVISFDRTAKNPHLFYEGLSRLKQGEPVAYVTGQTSFFGLQLTVTKAVLIPRPETEELVQKILQIYSNEKSLHIIDIGTGSGAIALALKFHRPAWTVFATDIDEKALKIAQLNANQLNLKINFLTGNGLQPLKASMIRFDLVVSNPPYIDDIAKIDPSVINFEPHQALLAAPATKFYEQYLFEAKELLNPHAVFAFEIDPSLVKTLPPIITKIFPEATIHFFEDINHKIRMVLIYTNRSGG
jgi:release factor glutamine methyltransferase